MIFFRRPKHYRPTLNMASMPDLIFTILFFFILVTRMREVTLKVKYTTPEGTEITQQAKKHDVIHIYIGPPANWMQRFAGRNTHIQINDKFVSVDEITDYLAEKYRQMTPEEQENMTVMIKADRHTSMKVITEVKQALRKAGALRISYSATSLPKKDETSAN